ncbi:MAG: hypothetical protein LC774_04185 [Acidobacteria bacterium]|nr:hypothetical protein [Acidobacteriota bacterium]
MKRFQIMCAVAVVCALAAPTRAQRPRTGVNESQQPAASAHPAPPPPAPASFKAKYEGGFTGYQKKQTGTLNFDDAGGRLVFKDKYMREYFSLPYKSLAALWGDTRAVTSNAARVVSAVPIYGIGLTSLLMPKSKSRYLVAQFDDPDTQMTGATSFKLESKELLASVLATLAQKAELKPRGEAFIRPQPGADKVP